MMDLLFLAVALLVILAGAELFTNGIEWFGRKLELAEGAVGSVLAAVGFALSMGSVGLAYGVLVGAAAAGLAAGAFPFVIRSRIQNRGPQGVASEPG